MVQTHITGKVSKKVIFGEENKMEYLLGLYEKSMPNDVNWIEKLKFAKENGYDYLEISIDETDEKLERLFSQEKKREIKDAIKAVDFPIYSMCLSGHRKYPLGSLDEKTREKSLEIMEKAVDFSAELGIRIIQLAGYDVYYEESNEDTRELFEKNLKKAVLMAHKKGIVLGFETMETEFMDTVKKAMEYVSIVNSPFLHVYPDIGNIKNAAVKYKNNVYEDIKSGEGHIVAAHLKETIPGVFREKTFGTGHVDFDKSIKLLLEMGVRLFVTELWWNQSDDWKEEIRYTSEFFRKKFKTILEEEK